MSFNLVYCPTVSRSGRQYPSGYFLQGEAAEHAYNVVAQGYDDGRKGTPNTVAVSKSDYREYLAGYQMGFIKRKELEAPPDKGEDWMRHLAADMYTSRDPHLPPNCLQA